MHEIGDFIFHTQMLSFHSLVMIVAGVTLAIRVHLAWSRLRLMGSLDSLRTNYLAQSPHQKLSLLGLRLGFHLRFTWILGCLLLPRNNRNARSITASCHVFWAQNQHFPIPGNASPM